MTMASSVILPAEVLASLAPALEAVREEVREGVRSVMVPRIVRAAQVAVRVNGAKYAHGAAAIVGAVTDPRALRMDQLLAARDEDVQEATRRRLGTESVTVPGNWLPANDGDDDDDEEEEEEEEEECPQDRGTDCCGYCRDCGTHHDEDPDYLSNTCRNCGYCADCGHTCSDY
jgi:hypothetical protein